MKRQPDRTLRAGDFVVLTDEADCIVPAGRHRVSKVNPDGSFHVGGNTAVWPRRIAGIERQDAAA